MVASSQVGSVSDRTSRGAAFRADASHVCLIDRETNKLPSITDILPALLECFTHAHAHAHAHEAVREVKLCDPQRLS